MVFTQPRVSPREWDAQNSQEYLDISRSNLGQMTRPRDSIKKYGTSQIVNFAFLADHRAKFKENEKRNKY